MYNVHNGDVPCDPSRQEVEKRLGRKSGNLKSGITGVSGNRGILFDRQEALLSFIFERTIMESIKE